jgi:hypothetical protein
VYSNREIRPSLFNWSGLTSPETNEPAALEQRITVRAAQNVDHIEIIDAERKRFAALWADRGNLEFWHFVIFWRSPLALVKPCRL